VDGSSERSDIPSPGAAPPEEANREAALRADTARLGVWLAVIALSMLFLALIGCFIVQRAGASVWPPEGVRLNAPLGLVATAVIAASSAALEAARRRSARRNREGARLPIQLAGALALGFLGLQTLQYYWLIDNFGQTIRTSQFSTYFFALTGLHALHLLAGVVWLLVLMARGSAGTPLQVELCGRYWHFVTLLWAILFVILYVF